MQEVLSWFAALSEPLRITFLVIFIFLITSIVARLARTVLNRSFAKYSKDLKVDPTRYTFLKHSIVIGIYVLGLITIIYQIPGLRALSVSLLAGAGVLAVVVGFASQQAFSNIISGIFIVLFRPFRVGDRIEVQQDLGIVEDITLRHTVIRNFRNERIILPNTVISNERIMNANISDDKICRWIQFGISYDSSADKAKKIMQQEAEKHPLCIDNRTPQEKKEKKPKVQVRVVGYGDSSVNLTAFVWAANPGDAWLINCDLNESIKKAFDKAGIEIPFPHRTIVYKNAQKIGKSKR